MQSEFTAVPWQAMLAYAPFRELLIFNLIYATVIGSLSVFAIEFFRDILISLLTPFLTCRPCRFSARLSSCPLAAAW